MRSPIVLECWDWNRSGTHDYIGSLRTTVRQLANSAGVDQPLINEDKQRRKGSKYRNSGTLRVVSVSARRAGCAARARARGRGRGSCVAAE